MTLKCLIMEFHGISSLSYDILSTGGHLGFLFTDRAGVGVLLLHCIQDDRPLCKAPDLDDSTEK